MNEPRLITRVSRDTEIHKRLRVVWNPADCEVYARKRRLRYAREVAAK